MGKKKVEIKTLYVDTIHNGLCGVQCPQRVDLECSAFGALEVGAVSTCWPTCPDAITLQMKRHKKCIDKYGARTWREPE